MPASVPPPPPAPTSAPAASPTGISALLARAGIDWFLLGLLGVVALAWWAPGLGSKASPVPWKVITTVGVTAVFFFYGLRLSFAKLREGMRNWRLHVVVQLVTFGLFPLLALLVRPFFGADKGELLWQSIFFLCTLPSTVSTSVVMVSVANGNVPAAIFNASISSLLGIVVTPLWLGLLLPTAAAGAPVGSLVTGLIWQVVVPVTAGMLLNRRFGAFAERHRLRLRTFDQLTILLIVFTAFCDSFAEGLFSSFAPLDLALLGAGMVALYYLVFFAVGGLSRLLHFDRDDRITALFCGSKKSLVQGSVMASLLFPASPATGLLLLPLMLYHALQIILASVMAQRMGRESVQPAPAR
ncbi:bile acid:sodium symporter [Hymenobacter sp. BT175]|uniref:bile acid:sodium symporter family protein n=1 Tax=Hymenobacter translucens TaxID=2886507 RepID=UPI001D0F3E2C|nr:bile acid:sodium symporter family protein [Hymenobacter translucens]MCC2546504.1 bile acid:sodium symporter [Hymenobacter translucens]